jgi:hypothetical protein
MSFITGTTLLSLFVTLALHQWDLSLWKSIKFVIKARLNIGYLLVMLLAGFVPGVAFGVEYYLARKFYPDGIPPRVRA